MALQLSTKQPKNSNRNMFEQRLKSIKGIKFKEVEGYTKWRLFCDYLVIRTYDKKYSIHTNGDIDHYEMKKENYDGIDYDVSDAEFISNLLENKL